MKTEIENIIQLLNRTYSGDAWHGPTVKEVLKDLTPELATKSIAASNSIITLIAHMTAWRIFTIEKLKGNAAYKVSPELNFPDVTDLNNELDKLEASQQQLIEAIRSFPPERLTDIIPDGTQKYTYYALLHGIIHHDLYHAGQIMIMKKYA
ncbi:DinB family protein [Chryseosolibacter indicus]|uniref:DinB family protein n=1 Tax=Chryseosolibacter indicus TaxID=2782351 RepID=A0ABS5VKP5_9BACT|nr:DinB family protein [Chryseosolibacter indicus]MBT1702018.1 DinB family protein [Chryseosolibacter indicus]